MKHIIRINEWKTSKDELLDPDNISELEDIFLPITDFSVDKFNIETDGFIPQTYLISWKYDFSFSISNGVNSNSIMEQKDRIDRFNKLQDEVRDILERLILLGYTIPYYNCSEDNSECYDFIIRISKR